MKHLFDSILMLNSIEQSIRPLPKQHLKLFDVVSDMLSAIRRD